MSIKKMVFPDGETKWVVRIHEAGRGSKRYKRIFSKKSDAEGFVLDIQKRNLDQKRTPFSAPTFSGKKFCDEAEYWYESIKLNCSAGHLKATDSNLKSILLKFGQKEIEELTPQIIQKFQIEEKSRGLENSTINKKVQVILSVLNHSVKHRRIPYSPLQGLSKLQENDNEMLFWEKSEAQSFLKYTSVKYPASSPDRWKYVVYLLALNTAMRSGEIWGLKAKDLTEDGTKLVVRRQFAIASSCLTHTKGKSARVVPCNPELRDELVKLIAGRGIGADEMIFMSENRTPQRHMNFINRTFQKDIDFWAKLFSGKKIRFHDLRHTATTLFVSEGIDLRTVQGICGHADIKTTMRYAHLIGANIGKVSDQFSVSMKSVSNKTTANFKETKIVEDVLGGEI